MKRTRLATVVISTAAMISIAVATTTSADDILDGKTAVKNSVIKGDLQLTAPANFDFGSEKLANSVINFAPITDSVGQVTDYTGDNTGYAISASVTGVDTKAELKVNDIALNTVVTSILKTSDTSDTGKADADPKTDKIGDNAFHPIFNLVYKDLDHLIAGDTATITWILSKTDISGVSE